MRNKAAAKTEAQKIAHKKSYSVAGHPEDPTVECWVDNSDVSTNGSAKVVIHAPFLKGSPAVVHWGCLDGSDGWSQPDGLLPPDTTSFGDQKAAQTPFHKYVSDQCHLIFAGPEASKDDASPASKCPKAPGSIAFVLKQEDGGGSSWWKSSDGDFVFSLSGEKGKSGHQGCEDIEALNQKFIIPEATYTNWSQFSRFIHCVEILKKQPIPFETAAWLTTVLRLATLRMLDWFRNYNYQPKDFSHIQEQLAWSMTNACVKSTTDHRIRALLRLCMNYIPRGGSNSGDAIRMTILNIMRTHGIREGHRPGIEDKFLEEWHQKLHTNSAPDDINICEAYIHFLDTGNVNDFWGYLETKACLSKARLANLQHPLTANPFHLPQLKHDMCNFLNLLKSVHSGADLDYMAEVCKGQMDHAAECMVFDILHHRHDWWVPGKINECRHLLKKDTGKRDVLMLDCALENWQITRLAATEVKKLSQDDALNVILVLLDSLFLSRQDASIDAALAFIKKVQSSQSPAKSSPEWCRLMLAGLDRLAIVCTYSVDSIASTVQRDARLLAEAITKSTVAIEKFDTKSVAAFGEETARSLPELQLSQLIRHVTPQLRKSAGLGSWDVISNPARANNSAVVGKALLVDNLSLVPQTGPACEFVVCAKHLTGWEDIPVGVAALLVPPGENVDILSHIAIRARTQKVLLACCADTEEWANDVLSHFTASENLSVSIDTKGAVLVSKDNKSLTATATTTPKKKTDASLPTVAGRTQNDFNNALEFMSPETTASTPTDTQFKKASKLENLIMSSTEVLKNPSVVGGKSLGLLRLAGTPDAEGRFLRPWSMCLPFGVFEEEISSEENKTVNMTIKDLLRQFYDKETADASLLSSVRSTVVKEMKLSDKLDRELEEALKKVSMDEQTDEVVDAVKKVWASKWNERAVSSRKANKIPDNALLMGVLMQNLIDANYAFVIHTKNPLLGGSADVTLTDNESLIEIVVGLGEPLVSNAPGKPLSAVVSTTGGSKVSASIIHYPSKNEALFAPPGGSVMCRSDSNGEDLPQFAGAGLYDSFPALGTRNIAADYVNEKLVFDAAFREELLERLFWVGQEVLKQTKSSMHQDIEGCVSGNQIYLIQTRAQM